LGGSCGGGSLQLIPVPSVNFRVWVFLLVTCKVVLGGYLVLLGWVLSNAGWVTSDVKDVY